MMRRSAPGASCAMSQHETPRLCNRHSLRPFLFRSKWWLDPKIMFLNGPTGHAEGRAPGNRIAGANGWSQAPRLCEPRPGAGAARCLLTNHGYPAVREAAEHIASRAGARVVEAPVPFPTHDPAEIIAAVSSRLGPRTRLVILDHVPSATAVIFPADKARKRTGSVRIVKTTGTVLLAC